MILQSFNLIEEIIKKQIPCYFISPHLDDAIFSAGGLISYLAGKTTITVVNVFTSCGDGKNTISAKTYLKKCGSKSAQRLYEIRLNEDRSAFSKLNIPQINLGFTDALWRKNKDAKIRFGLGKILPELNSLYPTYSLHIISRKIHKDDSLLENEIKSKLDAITGDKDKVIVFCPMGFGNHVDHLIVKNACLKSFSNLVFWTDFPYYLKKESFNHDNSLTKFIFKITTDAKKQLSYFYASQLNQIEDKTAFYKSEAYYLKNSIKDKIDIQIEQDLNEKLLKEWEQLWAYSQLKHYFNSPSWFLACQNTFSYPKHIFVKCYKNSKLIGIVPLVSTKEYGIKSFSFAGNQYLAKSPILLAYADNNILKSILLELTKLGNYYLSEITEELLDFSTLTQMKIGYARSSTGSFLPLSPDPYKYLYSNNRRKIIKKIKEEEGQFRFELSKVGFEQDLKLMKSIEKKSTKAEEFKESLTDPNLCKLYLSLGNFNSASLINYVLYYKDEAICYRSGFIQGNTFHGTGTAYKASYRELIPGKISIFLLLPELVKMGVETIDFSRGISPLKKEFTPFSYKQYLLFYSPNPLTMLWWKILINLKNYLEDHPFLFEIVRKAKKKVGLKIPNFGRSGVKTQESVVKL